jgi:hypothetical protein
MGRGLSVGNSRDSATLLVGQVPTPSADRDTMGTIGARTAALAWLRTRQSLTVEAAAGDLGGQPLAEVDAPLAEHLTADRGIEDVLWDQRNVGPTGWEPQFDPK